MIVFSEWEGAYPSENAGFPGSGIAMCEVHDEKDCFLGILHHNCDGNCFYLTGGEGNLLTGLPSRKRHTAQKAVEKHFQERKKITPG